MECNLGNIKINYETYGEGKPIVIVPGWTNNIHLMSSIFEPIFQKRDGWKRIYLDMPGMGKTLGMDWITNQDQMLDILIDFVDQVIPSERFSIAGYSYGGYLARGVVYKKSDVMDGLLLIASSIKVDGTQEKPPHITLFEDPDIFSGIDPEIAEIFQSGPYVVQSQKMLDAAVNLWKPAWEMSDKEFLSRIEKNINLSFDVDNLPTPFSKPTLIILGRQDSICGYRDAWNILENYPRGTFIVLDRAGHFLVIVQKDIFTSAVNEWLDRVEEDVE